MIQKEQLSSDQALAADFRSSPFLFLEGNPGTGKTTAALQRLNAILDLPLPGQQTLVLVPAKTALDIYQSVISARGNRASVMTFSTFVKRAAELFWPEIAETAGFSQQNGEPIFLTNETSQVFMAEIIRSKIQEGYFNALKLTHSRTYNQILIAFHKLAAAGIPFDDYANIMKSAWTGERSFLEIFDHVQDCLLIFENLCKERNLLDYAIQLQIFNRHLLRSGAFQTWFCLQYRHLIFDNTEEEIPIAHDLCEQVLPKIESALFVYDHQGGFRNFMGADPNSARRFYLLCGQTLQMKASYVNSENISALAAAMREPEKMNPETALKSAPAFAFRTFRDYSAMIKQTAMDVVDLIRRLQVPPREIAIIAPLNSDILYLSLERELRIQNIPCYIHRPSRPLISERETKSFVTLIGLLHPEWEFFPSLFEITQMLGVFIPELDPLRAQRLASAGFVLTEADEKSVRSYKIKAFKEFSPDFQANLLEQTGLCYEKLRSWIQQNQSSKEPADISLTRFFHEVLSQAGFSSYRGASETVNLAAGKVIESMKKFRRLLEQLSDERVTWKDYFSLVQDGMVSAFYFEDWFAQPEDAVLVTLAGTYILMNKPASYQIWLNAGASRWWERIYGQITNDVILSRNWQSGDLWDADMNFSHNDMNLNILIQSLLARCRKQVRIYASELNESGQDQKSRFLYFLSAFANQLWQMEKTHNAAGTNSGLKPLSGGTEPDPASGAIDNPADDFSADTMTGID